MMKRKTGSSGGGDDADRRITRRARVELIKYNVENSELDEICVFQIDSKKDGGVLFSDLKMLCRWTARLSVWLLQVLLPVTTFLSTLVFVLFALFLVTHFIFGWNPLSRWAEREVQLAGSDLLIPTYICVASLVIALTSWFFLKLVPTSYGEPQNERTNLSELKKLLSARETNLEYYDDVNNISSISYVLNCYTLINITILIV